MMTPHDKAHELARALADSGEYQEFVAAKEKLRRDTVNHRMLEDFRQKQWELQVAQVSGQEVEEDKIQQLERVYQLLSLNPVINEYLTAEYRFSRVLGDIQKIIAEAVDLWFDHEGVDPRLN